LALLQHSCIFAARFRQPEACRTLAKPRVPTAEFMRDLAEGVGRMITTYAKSMIGWVEAGNGHQRGTRKNHPKSMG
jgi:hypothetical protein